jgi:hypothetical protein
MTRSIDFISTMVKTEKCKPCRVMKKRVGASLEQSSALTQIANL